jgi:hypothetical protein
MVVLCMWKDASWLYLSCLITFANMCCSDSSDLALERCKVCRGIQEAIYLFNVLLQDQKGNRVLAIVSSQDNVGRLFLLAI